MIHFIQDETVVLIGDTVHYTNQSIGYEISSNWSFGGGNPSASTDENPVVVYSTAGTFEVMLTVTDGETYTSRLSTVVAAFATTQADDDGEVNVTISGRTITINAAGMTDVKIALLIKGYL